MTRAWLRSIARGLIGVLFLAQVTIAAHACQLLTAASTTDAQMQMPPPAASTPDPTQAGVVGVSAASPDCERMAAAMDTGAPNLCAEHCKYGQQSDTAATLTVPALLLTALYATPFAAHRPPPSRPAPGLASALAAASPPHAILHCVYRI